VFLVHHAVNFRAFGATIHHYFYSTVTMYTSFVPLFLYVIYVVIACNKHHYFQVGDPALPRRPQLPARDAHRRREESLLHAASPRAPRPHAGRQPPHRADAGPAEEIAVRIARRLSEWLADRAADDAGWLLVIECLQ
jgi:hypothetical protein